SAHIEYHAQIVHQKYLAREAVVGFNKLFTCAMDETIDIYDTLIDAHNLLDRLEGESGHHEHMRCMDTLMTDTLKEAELRIAKSANGVTGIPTGLTDLDQKTGGLQDSDLIIIAARPSVGKTAFALHLARSAAMAGNAVAVYSLEMQGERLADRWLAAAGNINPYRWRNGIPTPEEIENAHTTASELSGLPIYVDDNSSVSMDHIRSSARLLKSRQQCDMIIIDYLQLCDMTTKQTNRNREQEVAQATRKAKLLAKELHIPIVLLSQLNRESENRPGGRPELAHLRESGAIEQDADVVMLLYRPAMQHIVTDRESGYPTEELGVVIVAKQRNGETGNVYFGHNSSMTKIYDYVPPLEYLEKHAK
ncbi:replicative DNA helicase, partial [Bacteroides ovatus]